MNQLLTSTNRRNSAFCVFTLNPPFKPCKHTFTPSKIVTVKLLLLSYEAAIGSLSPPLNVSKIWSILIKKERVMPEKILNGRAPVYLDEGEQITKCTKCKSGNVIAVAKNIEMRNYGRFIVEEFRCVSCLQLFFNTFKQIFKTI